MKQIRWGFIGCGEVTELKSGPAFRDVEGSDIVAVMGRNALRTRMYAKRHRIPKWYTDASELIEDPDVNAVYVATPPSSHATYAIMSMRAGKPVYVEKPLASSYDDCARINRVCEQTGVPCFVAYYRRYLPYFMKVMDIVKSGKIGKIMNVEISFSCPPREHDYSSEENLPWRLQPEISGGGYFYDLAPHQLDLLQHMFGVIVRAEGICSNRAGLYKPEDNISACFQFESGVAGSGSWCFVGHESSRDDSIKVIGDAGMVSFSVYDYTPIELTTSEGHTSIDVPNPPYVQLPIIKNVIEHLQGLDVCECTSVSGTPVNWVMDRILGKF
ncbi:MAG: Gfo/Idh/MocA family oxidoreductase [Prevotella sp.]|nr:Gfo/Idh/MocA family oxidoreductase [Prevotella sp.]